MLQFSNASATGFAAYPLWLLIALACAGCVASRPQPVPLHSSSPVVAAQFSSIAAPVLQPRTNIVLFWDYPVSTAGIIFRMRTSTNISIPLNQWTVAGEATNVLTMSLPILPDAQRFYYVTAVSEWWGVESDPSNVASTPPLPATGTLAIE